MFCYSTVAARDARTSQLRHRKHIVEKKTKGGKKRDLEADVAISTLGLFLIGNTAIGVLNFRRSGAVG